MANDDPMEDGPLDTGAGSMLPTSAARQQIIAEGVRLLREGNEEAARRVFEIVARSTSWPSREDLDAYEQHNPGTLRELLAQERKQLEISEMLVKNEHEEAMDEQKNDRDAVRRAQFGGLFMLLSAMVLCVVVVFAAKQFGVDQASALTLALAIVSVPVLNGVSQLIRSARAVPPTSS